MVAVTRDEKLADIKAHPEKHKHTFEELTQCCMSDGALDTAIMEAHAGLCGSNGGVPCDTREGPCACGAWH